MARGALCHVNCRRQKLEKFSPFGRVAFAHSLRYQRVAVLEVQLPLWMPCKWTNAAREKFGLSLKIFDPPYCFIINDFPGISSCFMVMLPYLLRKSEIFKEFQRKFFLLKLFKTRHKALSIWNNKYKINIKKNRIFNRLAAHAKK